MADAVTTTPGTPAASTATRRPRVRATPGGTALLAVGAAFLVLQLVLVPWPFGLSTDEATYLAKVDPAVPELYWTEPRAWGMPWLAAPVALFSAPVEVVRVYFAVLSSVALAGAFWPWLRVLPDGAAGAAGAATMAAPVAAALFGTTWFALFFGPQVMPNLYAGLGAVAVVGLYLRAAARRRPREVVLAGLAVAFVAVVRPTDSVLVVAPLVALALLVPRLRWWPALGALVAGGVLGWLPWIVEAFLRFGDPLSRLRTAEDAGPKGLELDPTYALALPRFLDGTPYYVRADSPAAVGPVSAWMALWLLALAVVLVVGLRAAAGRGRLPELLAVILPAALLAAFYLLLPAFTSTRFLVPVFALLAVPAAYAVVSVVGSVHGRARSVLVVLLVAGAASHVGLGVVAAQRNLTGHAEGRAGALQQAAALRPVLDGENCLLVGIEPQAAGFYLGCRVQQAARQTAAPPPRVTEATAAGADLVAVLPEPPPADSYLAEWEPAEVPGLPAGLTAYRPPG